MARLPGLPGGLVFFSPLWEHSWEGQNRRISAVFHTSMGTKPFLEAGKSVNTHGIRGEVKIQPWSNGPDFLSAFSTVYIDGAPFRLTGSRVHKGCLIAALDGIQTVDDALLLKNKIVYIRREDCPLAPGEFFLQDLYGLQVLDGDTGAELGVIRDVLDLPAGRVYEIQGARTILVPAVPDFIMETNVEAGYIKIRLIKGM